MFTLSRWCIGQAEVFALLLKSSAMSSKSYEESLGVKQRELKQKEF